MRYAGEARIRGTQSLRKASSPAMAMGLPDGHVSGAAVVAAVVEVVLVPVAVDAVVVDVVEVVALVVVPLVPVAGLLAGTGAEGGSVVAAVVVTSSHSPVAM